jgi:protein N-terminal methyltransferase
MGPALADAIKNKNTLVALDCGAGVGRVSKEFLLHHFHEVDLVEPSAHLLEAARKDLGGSGGGSSKTTTKPAFPPSHKAVGFFQQGLESFKPAPGRYDVIWVQWAMLYLTDEDAISFLNRCAAALKPGGMIFIKENVCAQGFIVDSEDASVTRSHAYNVELFTKRAGLKLAHTALQKDFPKQLFKVRMYALKPV